MSPLERELRDRLRKIYVDGWVYWKDPPDYMERIERQVEVLRECVSRCLGCTATVQTTPGDINDYYDIECPLTSGFPESRAELDYDQLEQEGPAEYFQLLLSTVAPVVAGVWHRFFIRDGMRQHEMFDFLSEEWFAEHTEHKPMALEIIRKAEEQGLTVLGWDITLLPADKDWPLARLMPEDPDLRHYLFGGYYDDWGGIVKPVRDTF
ncbi:hypothetical protein ACN28E_10090 [Archangium lansingense]|uniref:hypothetical protein n=1 Tax=Archangium lansingense TaxID=2995310 RepID=UPI003B7C63B7